MPVVTPLLIVAAITGIALAVLGTVSGPAGYGIALAAFAALMYREAGWGA